MAKSDMKVDPNPVKIDNKEIEMSKQKAVSSKRNSATVKADTPGIQLLSGSTFIHQSLVLMYC
jgi:hypothetical protein